MKMIKEIGILLFMICVLSFYDEAVHIVKVYNVNLDILYFGGWHLFAIMTALIFASKRKHKVEKALFLMTIPFFIINLAQNVASLNSNYNDFKEFVNNSVIDTVKLIVQILVILCFLIWISTNFKRV